MFNRHFDRAVRTALIITGFVGVTACSPDTPTGPTTVGVPLSIASLSPDHVLVTGGEFQVNGAGFQPGVVVTIDRGRVSAAFLSSSLLQVTAPSRAAGVVDVAVTNRSGETVVFPAALTYEPLPPMQIERAEPDIGSIAGGTLLYIVGQSFQAGATVTIGDQGAPAEIDHGSLYIDTPAHATGPVDIVVTNPDGETQRLSAGFTYAPPDTFSFTGTWEAYVRPAWSEGPVFEIVDDTVVRLVCGVEGVNLIPTPPPTVNNGAFSFAANGGQISGHVVADGEAAGTLSIPGCRRSGGWYAYRR